MSLDFFVLASSQANAASVPYDGVRKNNSEDCANRESKDPCYVNSYSYKSDDINDRGSCDVGAFNFEPFTPGAIDYNIDLSNKTCIGYLVGYGVSLFGVAAAASIACIRAFDPTLIAAQQVSQSQAAFATAGSQLANATDDAAIAAAQTAALEAAIAETAASAKLVAAQASQTSFNAATGAASTAAGAGGAIIGTFVGPQLASLSSIAAGGCAIEALSQAGMGGCCAAFGAVVAATSVSMAALAIIYGISKKSFEENHVCGEGGWFVWTKKEGIYVYEKGPYAKCLDAVFGSSSSEATTAKCSGISSDRSVRNVNYREYLYGGREYEISDDGACKNPESLESELGYKGGYQRYYMRGSGTVGQNFACERFAMGGLKKPEEVTAFECCKAASQNKICLESNYPGGKKIAFCDVGTSCKLGIVDYSIYQSKTSSNYICAKTQSVCPFDHLLGGGTEVEQLNTKNSEPKNRNIRANFCQYMRHCTKVLPPPSVRISDLSGLYISSVCKNMVGDSQQSYDYSSALLPMNSRSFTAPMVQCLKETVENNFFRTAGTGVCNVENEMPDKDTGVCPSGNKYTKGQNYDTPFFVKIQDRLRNIIKWILVFSVILLGLAAFMALPGEFFNKKILMGFILKFALVAFFTLGNAWQGMFFDSLINIPSQMMNLTFHPFYDANNPSRNDGCNFPRYNHALKKSPNDNLEKYKNPSYPDGKSYLKPWDVIDCKLIRALGYGPEVNVPNIIIMIITGVFFGAIGVMFFLVGFAMFFLLFYIAIRSMHIFMMSMVAILLLVYVSPITIVAAMFEKTKNIFENWRKQLFGFVFQPMILFAYLGMLFTVLDVVFIGSARFVAGGTYKEGNAIKNDNDGRFFPKKIDCSKYALDSAGAEVPYDLSNRNIRNFDPENDGLYCMFSLSSFQSYDGFEPFGITIPVMKSMNKDKVHTMFKLAVLLFVFVTFLEKITYIATKLVGGAELKSDWNPKIHSKIAGVAAGIQQRGLRGAKKLMGSAGGMANRVARRFSSKYSDAVADEGRGNIAANTQSEKRGDFAVQSRPEERGGRAAYSTPEKTENIAASSKEDGNKKGAGNEPRGEVESGGESSSRITSKERD